MPSDAGAWIIADQQSLDEILSPKTSKGRRHCLQRQQPIRHRFGWRESACLEIIAPAVAPGQTLARPLLEAKGCKIASIDPGDQRPLLFRCDELMPLSQPRQKRLSKQIGLTGGWMREHIHRPASAQNARLVCTGLVRISSTKNRCAGGVTSRSVSGTWQSSHCMTCRRWMMAPWRS